MKIARTQKSVHDLYRTLEILGQGTYGVVYKAENRVTGEVVAMKRCRLDAFRDFGIPETTLREIALLKDLKHENVMRVHHVSCNTERLYLVSEYVEYDLKKYLRAQQPNGLSISQVKRLTHGILSGLAYCHGHRVIHRDLKPHNVLVSADGSKIRIADFGLARSALAPGKTLTHEVITLWYRAPELLLGHCNYEYGVDIWSVGCIMAEMLSSRPLFVGDSEIDTLFRILRQLGSPAEADWPEHAVVAWKQFPRFTGKLDKLSKLHPGLDAHGVDLMEQMFAFNASKRIGALEALRHPWFDELQKEPLYSEVELWRRTLPADALCFLGDSQPENLPPRTHQQRDHLASSSKLQQSQQPTATRRQSLQATSTTAAAAKQNSTAVDVFQRLRRTSLTSLIPRKRKEDCLRSNL